MTIMTHDLNTTAPSRVIVFGMLKGGTGKTTSAIFSALHYAQQGERVVVLDGDQTSQSAYDWWRIARASGEDLALPFEVVRFPFVEDIAAEISRLRQEYDRVIVDAGGGNASYLEEACSAADVLLMPVAPTGPEVRRIPATITAAERAAARNPRGLVAFCCMVKGDNRTSQPRRWRKQLVDDGHPLTDTAVSSLVLYSDAYGTRPEAVGEFAALLTEVDQELDAQ